MLKNKTALSLSPLALLTLAACGGTSASNKVESGKVSNGPLQNALAYLEYDAVGTANYGTYNAATDVIGTVDAGMTSATGAYSITAKATGNYTLMAATTDLTLDTVSKVAYGAGVTLKAPVGATAINPATTLVAGIMEDPANSALSAAQAATKVAEALGFADVNFLTYDPYADQTNMSTIEKQTALDVQLTANKVMTVVKTLAAAGVESGMSATEAATAAMDGIVGVVQAKVTNIDLNTAGTAQAAGDMVLDFDVATDLVLVNTAIQAEVAAASTAAVAAGGAAYDTTAFDLAADAAKVAMTNLIEKIETITLLNKDTAGVSLKDVLQSINLLVADVKTEAASVVLNNSHVVALDFTDPTKITDSMANAAPTDLKLSGSTTTDTTYSATSDETVTRAEGSSLAVGTVTVVDAEVSLGVADTATYSKVTGLDSAYFNVSSGGVITFIDAPDFETKSTYKVAVKVTDGAKKEYIETFNITLTDVDESGAFQISNNMVTWTDYIPSSATAGTDVTNKVMTTTTDSTKTVDMGGIAYLDHTNLTYLFDAASAGTTGKTPILKFTLSDVPTGVGSATIKASILDHNGVDGTEGTRVAGESGIEITVKVNYAGDGTTATLTAPEQADASGSYIKADGTTGTFTLANVDADTFSITQANAVTGMDATLDVKMSALYDAFIEGAGTSDMLNLGKYSVAIETTLPLADAPADSNDTAATVTKFQGVVELVEGGAYNTITGTSGVDAITAPSTGALINGNGGADTIALGSGTDYVLIGYADGSATAAGAPTVTNFTDGTDKFAFTGLTNGVSDLNVVAGTDAADSLISIKASASASGAEEYLMHVTGVAYTYLSPLGSDYISVDLI